MTPNATDQSLYFKESNTHYYRIDSPTQAICVCVVPHRISITEVPVWKIEEIKRDLSDSSEMQFDQAVKRTTNYLNHIIVAKKKPIFNY